MPPTPCTSINATVAKQGLPPVIPIRISTLHKTEATTRPQAAEAQGSKAVSQLSNVAAGRPRRWLRAATTAAARPCGARAAIAERAQIQRKRTRSSPGEPNPPPPEPIAEATPVVDGEQ
jgi:hypothetical protein